MNLGHIILVVVATVIGFILYDNITNARKKAYFSAHKLSKEERAEMEKDALKDRLIIIVRLAIWCVSAVFALLGDTLGVILTVFFTLEALFRMYTEAYGATKSRVSALTLLAIPFGALIMAYGMKSLGIVWGIILGILTIILVQVCHYIGRTIDKE